MFKDAASTLTASRCSRRALWRHTEIVHLKDITGVANRDQVVDVFLRNRLTTACVFSLSSRAKAQEFVNALNMVM